MPYSAPYWDEQYMLSENVLSPEILAFGDSWLHYPFNNLASEIHAQLGQSYAMLVAGDSGQEAQDWINKKRFAAQAKKYVHYYAPTAKAIILSAGGNDFAGLDDFDPLLRDDCSGIASAPGCFESKQPELLFQTVYAAYEWLIGLVREQNATVPIFVHNYDYAQPSGLGLFGYGHWLKEPMDTAKVPRGLHAEVVRYLIDSFTSVIQGLEAEDSNIHLVKTAGTLAGNEWANELHPRPAAFRKLGAKHVAEIKRFVV